VLAGLLVVAAAILIGIASRRLDRPHDVPTPAIRRSTSGEALARGKRLFQAACVPCHTPAGVTGSQGRRLGDFPPLLGTVYSSNLTSDLQAGIGSSTDGEIARLLRYGVRRDRRYAAHMPRMKMIGDDDVAALIGFMRSGDPIFAPHPVRPPAPRLTLIGRMVLAFAGTVDTQGDNVVPVPAPGPTPAYGRYLATAFYGCVDCHTEGFVPLERKVGAANLLAGGFELPDPRGHPIESTNLTPDDSGIGKWKLIDFQRALLAGINPDGFAVRAPMPIFRYSDGVETEAIFRYLQTVPKVKRQTRVYEFRERLPPSAPPEQLFARLGCPSCHATDAPFHDVLNGSRDRPPAQVAQSIRNPEIANPVSQMPTYATLIDEGQALALAQWIQAQTPKAEVHPQVKGNQR
jgi:mono/diheme cytochrome c family protein